MVDMNDRAKAIYDYLVATHVATVARESFHHEFEHFLDAYNEGPDADNDDDDEDDEDALPDVGDVYLDENGDRILVTKVIDVADMPRIITAITQKIDGKKITAMKGMTLKEFDDVTVYKVN